MSTWSCRSEPPRDPRADSDPREAVTLVSLRLTDLRGYVALDATFGLGPQLVWGPNAAGKTSLLEAIALLAWGASHRTSTDVELIRWSADVARVEGLVRVTAAGTDQTLEVALVRPGSPAASAGGRKRVRVNGVPRRSAALGEALRVVLFAPEDMLLIAGSPAIRRAVVDRIAIGRFPPYGAALATYSRALQQRNSLLRAIRDENASRDELRLWDQPLLDSGAEIVALRHRLLDELGPPLASAHAEIAPEEGARGPLRIEYLTNAPLAPDESPREALARRLAETAEKEAWNGTTLIGPHRDDLSFLHEGRDLASFASRGQQRTAILALKLAELDLLTAADGRPPLLLLDDVFSELDPERRAHLVRRIAELPQAFVTTTTLEDLDPALRAIATSWEVRPGRTTEPAADARFVGPHAPSDGAEASRSRATPAP
ncbi:MAG TPA: DNA replication/repair protein RecF [Candidatus Eisenbacteria bacterium]|nr:DNA replication/repair protein RecF [Candidatus Eisenbacteria bacterium]